MFRGPIRHNVNSICVRVTSVNIDTETDEDRGSTLGSPGAGQGFPKGGLDVC